MPDHVSLNAKRRAAARDTDPQAFRACLELACAVTGMRVALIGAVTDTDWTAEHALDRAGLHIVQGMKLVLAKTFCLDVTRNEEAIWFSDYQAHAQHCTSPIPPMYGFRSYISVPVALPMAPSSAPCARWIRKHAPSPRTSCDPCTGWPGWSPD